MVDNPPIINSMKTIALITSRWNSKRLPGKALKMIGSKPLLQHVYDRVIQHTQAVVVTTSESQPIIAYCSDKLIPVFVSNNSFIDEENLIQRMVQAGIHFEAERVLRVWGDCPFLDHDIIEGVLSYKVGYVHPINTTNGLIVTSYNQNSFMRLYSLMTEGDKWHWNDIDEMSGWEKYGFLVTNLDLAMQYHKIRGLNINYQSDLDNANYAVRIYGENLSYKNLIEMYKEQKYE